MQKGDKPRNYEYSIHEQTSHLVLVVMTEVNVQIMIVCHATWNIVGRSKIASSFFGEIYPSEDPL